MSLDKPEILSVDGSNLYIAVVASRYNNDLVEMLLKRSLDTLKKSGVPEANIKVLRVPGAAEIPYVCNMVAATEDYDCVIALGVIVAGDTDHHTILAESTAHALQRIALDTEIPVINGIITANGRAQALARVGDEINRGAEFANAALEMAQHSIQLSQYLDSIDDAQEGNDEFNASNPFKNN